MALPVAKLCALILLCASVAQAQPIGMPPSVRQAAPPATGVTVTLNSYTGPGSFTFTKLAGSSVICMIGFGPGGKGGDGVFQAAPLFRGGGSGGGGSARVQKCFLASDWDTTTNISMAVNQTTFQGSVGSGTIRFYGGGNGLIGRTTATGISGGAGAGTAGFGGDGTTTSVAGGAPCTSNDSCVAITTHSRGDMGGASQASGVGMGSDTGGGGGAGTASSNSNNAQGHMQGASGGSSGGIVTAASPGTAGGGGNAGTFGSPTGASGVTGGTANSNTSTVHGKAGTGGNSIDGGDGGSGGGGHNTAVSGNGGAGGRCGGGGGGGGGGTTAAGTGGLGGVSCLWIWQF
jgi:hypothetical protein